MCEMIDFISISQHICKYNPYLGNCKFQSSFSSGAQKYLLEGCEEMAVIHNPSTGLLEVKGSLPYFLNGHNFAFTWAEAVEAIEIIDSMLGNVGLWGAKVKAFENGVIVPVDLKPKEYIAKHYANPSTHLKQAYNEQYAGKFAMWKRKGEHIKLYDAGANIKMKQGLARRAVIEGAGWNPEGNYLKCEVRYTNPDWLNGNKPLTLEELQTESFLDKLKENLMAQYHLLTPAKGLVLPSDKKDFKSLDILVFTLVEALMNGLGLSFEEAKKQVYTTIRQAECLTKSDKDARRRQIGKAFGKLEEAPASRWDLTNALQEALDAEI